MQRRTFLAAAAASTLARPALSAGNRPLIFVPQANLTVLDPMLTAATVTRNFALMVHETLYGRDIHYQPQPLMVEGHVIEDDGKRWTMRLRDGLLFHDGTPVRAQDCIASLQRWLQHDLVSATFTPRVAAIEAKDDRTLVWRLHKPFPTLPYFLSKVQPQPVIVPERLTKTDPGKQMTEVVGCGPLRFLPDEYVSGSRAVFARFDRYTPRSDPPSYAAGGHKVNVERVEWQIIPDPATAANALMAGEVDWLEIPQPDLMEMLAKQRGVSTGLLDVFGTYGHLRTNHLQGPTANPGVRRAMVAAINQRDEMIAVMGDDPTLYNVPVGYFLPGSQSANDAGMEAVTRRRSADEIKRMLDEAKYGGEAVAFLHPTDQLVYDALSQVAISAFKQVGLVVDDQTTDWGTILQRRNSKEPLDKGGWSIFPGGSPGGDMVNPLLQNIVRSTGATAWVGWPNDPVMEVAYSGWIDATNDADRKRYAQDWQRAAFNSVPTIPVGQYLPRSAWRSNITGLLKGSAPVFWGLEKT